LARRTSRLLETDREHERVSSVLGWGSHEETCASSLREAD
jgi:hypothetical protein